VEADLLDSRQAGHEVAGDPAAGEGVGRVQERLATWDNLHAWAGTSEVNRV
jgi:hypothetical protein